MKQTYKSIACVASTLILGVVGAQGATVILDYANGTAAPIQSTTLDQRSVATGLLSGGNAVTALFTSDLPVSGGSASTFTSTGTNGANGLGITGGVDDTDFDSDGAENFRVTIQLYTGYTDPGNRGTEVTSLFNSTLTGSFARVRGQGTYGLSIVSGANSTSGSVVNAAPSGNIARLNDLPDMLVDGPLIVTAVGTESGPYVYQLQQLNFDIAAIPEPSAMALLGLASLGLIARRKR